MATKNKNFSFGPRKRVARVDTEALVASDAEAQAWLAQNADVMAALPDADPELLSGKGSLKELRALGAASVKSQLSGTGLEAVRSQEGKFEITEAIIEAKED
jgi:hypothetical protein